MFTKWTVGTAAAAICTNYIIKWTIGFIEWFEAATTIIR